MADRAHENAREASGPRTDASRDVSHSGRHSRRRSNRSCSMEKTPLQVVSGSVNCFAFP